MPKMMFVNLPVSDVELTAGFYAALGAHARAVAAGGRATLRPPQEIGTFM